MQKLDHPPAEIVFSDIQVVGASTQVDHGSDSNRRLLVIVTDADFDAPATARRILKAANAFKSEVLFLGFWNDEKQEPSLHRQLITLSAMIRDEHVPFEIKIKSSRDWLNQVRSNWREGDVLVCFSGQRAGSHQTLIGPLLQSNFSSTIYVLNHQSQPESAQLNWKSTVFAWAGSIGIILGFLWMQINITQLSQDWSHTAWLYISIFAEVGLIWIWNSLFG